MPASNVDLSLQKRDPGHQGLRMGLSPGSYGRKRSWECMVFVDEDAFGLLEVSIGRRFPKYLNFGHWGATSIPREIWLQILDDWSALRVELLVGSGLSKNALGMAQEVLAAQVYGLVRLIEELSEWVREALSTHDHVSIHGI
jgi:hypothetical protein